MNGKAKRNRVTASLGTWVIREKVDEHIVRWKDRLRLTMSKLHAMGRSP